MWCKKIIITLLYLVYSFLLFAQEKKNLLFIITDQQRYDVLSVAGNSVIKTPNLDRLAQQGAYFKNAYTPCAVCCPARSSILTGHTIEHTGMKTNDAYFNVNERVMVMPTFDEILTENGYHCEYYGKWHSSSYHAGVYKNPQQESRNGKWIFGPGGQSYSYTDYLNDHVNAHPPDSGEFVDLISKFPYVADPLDRYYGYTAEMLVQQNKKHSQPDQHGKLKLDKEFTMTAFQAKQTIEALERLKDKTFSITCSFHFPHSPMLPVEPYYSMYPPEMMVQPPSISDNMLNSPYNNANGRLNRTEYADPQKIKYMISNYYGLVSEIDDWVGKILDKLDELGLADNTLVIFTSDHGEMLGAHGMREKNVFYEESSHIPLIVRFPNEINNEIVVSEYVSLVDLFPSILDYLNIPKKESDGKSLRGLIEGTDKEHGKYVVTEWNFRGDTEPNYMVVKDGWKLIIPNTIKSNVVNTLFNLNDDPYEMNNLLGSNPERASHVGKAEELRACLLEWLADKNSIHYYSVSKRDLLNGGKPTGNNASLVKMNVPELVPGTTVTVSVTMKNTGTTAWTKAGNFKLASQAPAENKIWGIDHITLNEGDSILPDTEKTFTFDVEVPDYDGSFIFQWQMLQEAEEWFGSKSEIKQVVIGNPGSYLDNCDDITDWKSSQAISVVTNDRMQGMGCLEFNGSGTDEFKKVFSPSYNAELTESDAVLQFWYYVSDPLALSDKNQVEIGSAGKPDVDEYNWKLTAPEKGWNLIRLNFNDAGKSGAPQLNKINWFRLYNKKSGSVTSRIDAIQIVDKNITNTFELALHSEAEFIIYPNPLNSEQLWIDCPNGKFPEAADITITDILGQVIYRNKVEGRKKVTINAGSWIRNSVYIVSINIGKSLISQKLIVR